MSDIQIELGLSTRELSSELQSASSKLNQFAGQTTSAGEKASKGFLSGFSGIGSELGGKLQATLGALGLTVGAAAVVNEIKSIIEEAHNLHHEAERFGIDAEQLQLIGNAAKALGIPLESSARLLHFLALGANAALDGTSKQAKALETLKIAATEYVNASPVERFLLISDAYRSSSQNAADYASAVTLMGKKIGGEFIPVLLQGRQAIIDNAAAMGTLSNQSVADLDRIYVANQRLWGQFKAFGAEAINFVITSFLAGSIQLGGVVNSLVEQIKGFGNAVIKFGKFDFSGGEKEIEDAKKRAADLRDRASEDAAKARHGKPIDEGGFGKETHPVPELLTPDADESGGGAGGARSEKISKEDREASHDAEKVREIERERSLASMPYEERHAELSKQAEFLNNAAGSADSEAERNRIKLEHYDIVKQIESEEKKHAQEMERSEKERNRELGKGGQTLAAAAKQTFSPGAYGGHGTADYIYDEHGKPIAPAYDHSQGTPGGVQSSGGLSTGSLSPKLSDADWHSQFQAGGGINDRLSSADDWRKQFQPRGLSRADEVKQAGIGKDAEKEKHLPVAEKQLSALEKISKNTEGMGKNK